MKKELFKKLLRLLSLEKDQNYDVLDFGCGSGRLLGKLHKVVGNGSKLIGFESSQKSVEKGRLRYPNVEFQHEKFIDAFSFPDECFYSLNSYIYAGRKIELENIEKPELR